MPAMPRWNGWTVTMAPDGVPERNKFVLFLTATLAVIMMAICIPYLMVMFVPTPFCDTQSTRILGSYAVMNGVIPLEQIAPCRTCPVYALCDNGTALCGEGNVTDGHGTICIPDGDAVASSAAIMAQRVESPPFILNVIPSLSLTFWSTPFLYISDCIMSGTLSMSPFECDEYGTMCFGVF